MKERDEGILRKTTLLQQQLHVYLLIFTDWLLLVDGEVPTVNLLLF